MSAGEREQLTVLLDDWYALARSDISTARSFAPRTLRPPRGKNRIFPAARSPRRRFRWIASGAGTNRPHNRRRHHRRSQFVHPASRTGAGDSASALPSSYALGVCAMDTGMGARRLVGEIASACAAADAVVLRVDSPWRRHPALGSRGRRRVKMPRAQARHRLAGLPRGFRAGT